MDDRESYYPDRIIINWFILLIPKRSKQIIKMNNKRSILLRNSATIILLCQLMFFLFPFGPIVWKSLFIAIVIIALIMNVGGEKKDQFDVVILFFFGIQLFYYIVGSFSYQSVIGNIAVCLLSFPLFSYFGRKGLLTEKYIRIVLIVFIGFSIIRFFYDKTVFLEEHNYEVSGTKVNFAMFLFIFPLLFAEKNKSLSVALFLICLAFNTFGAKRGNIIASIIPTILFLDIIRKNSTLKGKLLLLAAISCVVVLLADIIISNPMLVRAYNNILAGESSGRDWIYTYFWNKWKNSDNIFQLLFGYGFAGTVKSIGLFAHNDWIELLIDNGLIGVCLYLILFISLFIHVRKSSSVHVKYMFLSILIIWFLKSLYSMGFSESQMSMMAIAYGYAIGHESRLKKS